MMLFNSVNDYDIALSQLTNYLLNSQFVKFIFIDFSADCKDYAK